MHSVKEINWSNCKKHFIDAGREDLPCNIKVIKADFLNASVLKDAVALMQPGVEVVQIEVPFSGELKYQAALQYNDENFKFPKGFDQTSKDLISHVRNNLDKVIPQNTSDVVLEWRKAVEAMPISVSEFAPDSYAQFRYLGEDVSNQTEPQFHNHAHEIVNWFYYDFFLNLAQGETGTVFLDSNQIACNHGRASLAFNTRTPDFWAAKGWSYILFRPHTWHSPPWDNTQRCTFVLPFAG